jgi:hypothetical protein
MNGIKDRPLQSMMVCGYRPLKILSVTCLLWTLTLCVCVSFSLFFMFCGGYSPIAHYFFPLMLSGSSGGLVSGWSSNIRANK